MLSDVIRKFLFNLVHLVIAVLVALKNVYRRVRTSQSHLSKETVTPSDIKLILKHTPRLKKKLHHLVFLADTHHHAFGELARLVIWSLVAGVPYVSFYDVTGDLDGQQEKLFLEIEKKKVGIPGCIKWANKPNLNGYTNGNLAHTISVNIFTKNNGRRTIAECIRNLASSELETNEHKIYDLTAEDFHKHLSCIYPAIPDPELVLYTGPVCCTHGLLPWQIRLTEFIPLSVNSNFNVEAYIGALLRFDKCDFRFGK